MSDYKPTTEEVREVYRKTLRKVEGIYSLVLPEDADAGFDRWLVDMKAEAWSSGALWALTEAGLIADENADWLAPGDNPYRGGQQS